MYVRSPGVLSTYRPPQAQRTQLVGKVGCQGWIIRIHCGIKRGVLELSQEVFCNVQWGAYPVSYTHLDVYKRQGENSIDKKGIEPDVEIRLPEAPEGSDEGITDTQLEAAIKTLTEQLEKQESNKVAG